MTLISQEAVMTNNSFVVPAAEVKALNDDLEAKRTGNSAGREDRKHGTMRENPYPKGDLHSTWHSAYHYALRGW